MYILSSVSSICPHLYMVSHKAKQNECVSNNEVKEMSAVQESHEKQHEGT